MTPARFHELRNRAVAAVDRVFAEPIAVRPQIEGNQYRSSTSDADRPDFAIEAILRTEIGSEDAGGEGQTWATAVPTGAAILSIDIVTWPAAREIRRGDIIRAVSRPGGPEYRVEQSDPTTGNRLNLRLTAR